MAKRAKSKPKQSTKEAERVLRTGPIRKKPRPTALPGMEDLRDRVLDEACLSLSEIRHAQADLDRDEAGHLNTSLRRMRELRISAFRAHGVELSRVPGEEKIRCRVTKEKATDISKEAPPDVTGDVDPMDGLPAPPSSNGGGEPSVS